jgi:hypothetical protein
LLLLQGRDANARLQRSLRAQRLREVLPGLLASLRHTLESWSLTEGAPFMYDGQDFMPQVE